MVSDETLSMYLMNIYEQVNPQRSIHALI